MIPYLILRNPLAIVNAILGLLWVGLVVALIIIVLMMFDINPFEIVVDFIMSLLEDSIYDRLPWGVAV